MRAIVLAGIGALSFSAPLRAADFTPPEGCTAFLSVQSKACAVSLLWRCDVAPEGDFWEAAFGADGLLSVVSYSRDYQWLDAVYMWDSSREEFVPPAADPIDLTALLDEGVDTYDFTMRRSDGEGVREVRMVGADQLSGEATTIDGHTLDLVLTELRILAEDGSVEYHSRGTQYFSRELEQFFLGPEQVFELDGAVSDYDGSPVDIILPGEPGFGATTPLYDCEQQKAGRDPAAPGTAQEETIHDQI